MNLALSSLANRLRRTLRSCPRLAGAPLPAIRPLSRSYSADKPLPRSSLFYRMFPLGDPSISLVPVLDRYMQKKKNVRPVELQHIVRELRKRCRYKQALEVSEWICKKGILSFMPGDHAMQLNLIGKVRGMEFAEIYFNSMDKKNQNEKTYGALLNCYVRERLTEKSLSHLEKMKKLGFASTTLTYNDLMCLYENTGQHEKVPVVLTEMKENGTLPDNFSYRICINSYGVSSNISEVEKLLDEMEHQPQIIMDWNTYAVVALIYIKARFTDKAVAALKKSEEKIEKKSGLCYNHLIYLYGQLRNKSEMKRLWELQKLNCKKFINRDYTTMLGALVKMGEHEEAEALLKEWESSGTIFDFRVPNVILVGYRHKGLVEKAETMVENFVKKGRTPISDTWGTVATGFAEKGEVRKAYQYMEKALRSYTHNAGWQPNPKAVSTILRWLGDEADVKSVETFVELLKFAMPVDRNVFHALIKAHIRAGKEIGGLLQKMKDEGVAEDEETKEILNLQKTE